MDREKNEERKELGRREVIVKEGRNGVKDLIGLKAEKKWEWK